MGLDIVSVSPNGPWSLSWEPSGQTFQPIEVYPNTTTTYIASITDANNCVTTDTLVLDVLCSNETLVDFEPIIAENETQLYFQMFLHLIIFYMKDVKGQVLLSLSLK